MSEDRPESSLREPGLTPWVGRLMVANVLVYLVLQTVLTAPAFTGVLQFLPDQALRRPWTFFSYMFVHRSAIHLSASLLLLLLFGPPVERRMGGRAFLRYYLYCGVGAATLAWGLTSFMAVPSFSGASGAVLGIALAFAFTWPEADLTLFPTTLQVRAWTLIVFLAGIDVVLALWINDGVAQVAHLGGLVAGYLFFRIQSIVARRTHQEPKSVARRRVMAPMPVRQGGAAADVRPALARPELREEYPAEEVDRVLDKISAFGIQSLTPEERRFLDEVSHRKRKDLH